MDDLSQQADEIEAVCAIYEREFETINAAERRYRVRLGNISRSAVLQITLPEDYPSTSPPQYELMEMAWIGSVERQQLQSRLDNIFLENIGSPILFLWIQEVKSFVEQFLESTESDAEDCGVPFSPTGCDPADPVRVSLSADQRLSDSAVTHGDCVQDRRSVFQGHCARVSSLQEAQKVRQQLLSNKKISSATHNIWAYRIAAGCSGPLGSIGGSSGRRGSVLQDCDDDGEVHAGSRLLHLLCILDVCDVAVMVSRWYGGILLGPDRFRHINNAARAALSREGLLPPPTHTAKSKTNKKTTK